MKNVVEATYMLRLRPVIQHPLKHQHHSICKGTIFFNNSKLKLHHYVHDHPYIITELQMMHSLHTFDTLGLKITPFKFVLHVELTL